MPRLPLPLPLLLVALGACGTDLRYTPLAPPPSPMHARPADSVRVFVTGRPAARYVEVGLLEVQPDQAFGSGDSRGLIDAMRVDAARIGCDGLILAGSADAVRTTRYGTRTIHGVRGVCVMFVGP